MKNLKEIKKTGKRLLSVVMCIAMLITTFCFFDIGSVISEAMVSTGSHDLTVAGSSSSAFSTYSINASELVYIDAGKTTSEYFLDNYDDGNVDGTTSSTGILSFSCSTAKAVSISAKLWKSDLSAVATDNYIKNVTFTNDSISGSSTSGTSAVTKSLSSFSSVIKSITLNAPTPGKEYIIEWTIAYTILLETGNTVCTTYAYTGVKCPSVQQAGLAQYSYYNGFYTDHTGQTAYSFITGADSVSGGNAASAFNNVTGAVIPESKLAPLYQFVGTANNGTNYTMPTGKDVINDTSYFPDTIDGGVFKFYDSSSRGKIWYAPGDNSNTYNPATIGGLGSYTNTTYGNATIAIDTSRYSNFNQIPNLSCGYVQFYHHAEGAGNYLYNIRNCNYNTSDATDYWQNGKCTDTTTSDKVSKAATLYCNVDRTDEGSGTDDRSVVRGLYPINGAIPASSGTTYMRFEYMNGYSPAIGSNELCANVATVKFTYNIFNNSTLRKELYEHYKSGVCDKASNWSSYIAAVRNMAKELCVTTNTATSYTDISSMITTAQTELKGKFIARVSDPLAFYVPEAIYLKPYSSSWGEQRNYPFQYFVQNSVNTSSIGTQPTPKTTTDTTGDIYFGYDNTSNVILSYRWLNSDGSTMGEEQYTTTANYCYDHDNDINIGGTAMTTPYISDNASAGYNAYKSVALSNGYAHTTINPASSYSPYLTASTTGCLIEWRAEYVDMIDGYTKVAVAYTYVYKPYVVPVASATRVLNKSDNDHYGQQISWLTGVQSISQNSSSYYAKYTTTDKGNGFLPFQSVNQTSINDTGNTTGAKLGVSLSASGVSHSTNASNMYSVFASTTAANAYFKAGQANNTFNEAGSIDWITKSGTASVDISTGEKVFNVKSADWNEYESSGSGSVTVGLSVETSAAGNISIDTSRYTNLAQIPNLGVGIMATDNEGGSGKGFWMVADMSDRTSYTGNTTYALSSADVSTAQNIWNENDGIIASQGSISAGSDSPSMEEGVKYAGAWDKTVKSPTLNSTQTYRIKTMYGAFQSDKYWASTLREWAIGTSIIKMSATQYNKAALRKEVNKALNNFANLGITDATTMESLYYNESNATYSAFVSAYKAAYRALVKVDGSISSPDTLANNLVSALDALLSGTGLATGTAKQYNVGLFKNTDGTYKMVQIKNSENHTSTYTCRDDVFFTADEFDGYTFAGSVKTKADFNFSGMLGNKLNTLPQFFSTSNPYDMNCNLSSGVLSFSRATMTQTSFHYGTTVGSTVDSQSTTPAYVSGDSTEISYHYSADSSYYIVNFYIVNSYHTYFDMNDGSSKVNLIGYKNYTAANKLYYDYTSKTVNGITASYDPVTSILTFNGTFTASDGQYFYFPLTLKSGTNYTYKFTYVSGSKTIPSGQALKVTFDLYSKSSTNSYPGGTRSFIDQSVNQANQTGSFTLTQAQVDDLAGVKVWSYLSNTSDVSASSYAFNNYKIKVELTESSSANSVFSPNSKYGQYATALGTLPVPEREGYEFMGWFTESSGGDLITASRTIPAIDRTLYAHWKAREYNVLLDNELQYGDFIDYACNSYRDGMSTVLNNNWYCGSTATLSSKFATQGTNPATITYIKNSADGDYTHIEYSRSSISQSGATASFDHYKTNDYTAASTGEYTVEFKYRITNFYSQAQVEHDGETGNESMIMSLSNSSTGIEYGGGKDRSFIENYTTTGGFRYVELTRSFNAGDKFCFEFVPYFYEEAAEGYNNSVSASVDIAHVIVRDSAGNIVFTSDTGSTSGGTTYYDSAKESVDISMTGTDAYTKPYNGSCYRMNLTPGAWYSLTFDYQMNTSGSPSLNPYVFFFPDSSTANYSSLSNGAINVAANENGVYTLNFQVPAGAHYVSLRFGVAGVTSGRCSMWNISVQRKGISADNAYNENVALGGLNNPTAVNGNASKFVYASTTAYVNPRWEQLDDHSITTTYAEKYTNLPVPAREGYTFVGWFDTPNATGGTQYTSETVCTTDNVHLYSRWNANPFDLVYNANKPANASSSVGSVPAKQTLKYGIAANTSTTVPTLTGWTFNGWSKTTSGEVYKTAGAAMSVAEVIDMYNTSSYGIYNVYAKWTANKITVNYNSNGVNTGSSTPSQVFTYDTYQKLSANGFARVYAVKYKENNPTGSDANITLGKATDTAEYKFSNWSSVANGVGGYSYTNEQNVVNPNGVTADGATTTLYAQWTEGNVTLPTATKAGYDFAGWYTTTTGGTRVGSASATYYPTNAIDLYAHWTARTDTPYKVNVYVRDANGNYPSSPTVYSYTGKTDTTATASAATYYPDNSGEFSLDTGKTNVLSGRITGNGLLELTVYVDRANHSVLYNYEQNGGTSVTVRAATVYYQGAISLTPVATKANWAFVGWNTESTATTKLTSLTMSTKDVVLYAVYSCAPKANFYYIDGTTQKYVTVTGATVYNNATSTTFDIPTISAGATVNSLSWTQKGFTTATTYAGGTVTLTGTMTTTKLTNASVTETYYMCYSATVTITHNANGGTLSSTNPAKTSYMNASSVNTQTAVDLTLQTPAYREGYVFLGWDTSSAGTSVVYEAEHTLTGQKANSSVYAVWKDVSVADEKLGTKDEYMQITTSVLKGIKVTDDSLTATPIYEGSVKKYSVTELSAYTQAYTAYLNAKTAFNAEKTKANNDALLAAANKLIDTAYPSENTIEKTYFNTLDSTGNFTITYDEGVTNKPISEGTHSLKEMNLNHYADLTLTNAKDAIINGKTYTKAADQQYLNTKVQTMAQSLISTENVKDTNPTYKVYETATAVKNSALVSGDVTAARYVYSGKGNYTYYCYASTATPTLLLAVNDVAGTTAGSTGRVCYPTTSAVKNADGTNATAGYTTSLTGVTNNEYSGYTALKMGTGMTGGAGYYTKKALVKLTPEFKANTNGTAVYTIESHDDALSANYADTATLSGKKETRPTATADTTVTPENTITVVVDYHQTTTTKGQSNTMIVEGDQDAQDKWLKQFHLYRTSGGASNWEFPKPGDTVYTLDDPTYGQLDNGSFTYTFTKGAADNFNTCTLSTTDVASVTALIKANYKTMKSIAFTGTNKTGGTGLGYLAWPASSGWNINYYPKSQAYTYVHLVDRWGNVYDTVVSIGNIDAVAPKGASLGNGALEITEDGGSGLEAMTLSSTSLEVVTGAETTYIDGVYKVTGDTLTVNTGEANKSYTLTITDNATNKTTVNVKTDANGVLTLKVSDLTSDANEVYSFELNGKQINLNESAAEKSIQSVTYEVGADGSGDYKVKVTGRPSKIRFTDENSNTWTYVRTHDKVSVTGYDEEGNEVGTLDRTLAYEIWTISTKLPLNKTMRATAKFGATFEGMESAYSFTVKPGDKIEAADDEIYSMELERTTGTKGTVKATVVTGTDVKAIRFVMPDNSTATYYAEKAEKQDTKLVFTGNTYMNEEGINNIRVMVKSGFVWTEAGTLSYMVES